MVEQFCNGIHNSEHNPQLCRQVDDDVQFEMSQVGLNRRLQVNKAGINSALVASYTNWCVSILYVLKFKCT